MGILTIGTGVSITVGTSEYADETTEYELAYDEPSAPDPVAFLDGHSETPPAATGGRSWTINLKGARSEISDSLYSYLWANDGTIGSFEIVDQGATYTFEANLKPAPLKSTGGEVNEFEVELTLVADPTRTGPV